MTRHVMTLVRTQGDGTTSQLSTEWTGTGYVATVTIYATTRVADDIDRITHRGEPQEVAQQPAGAFRWAAFYRFTDDLIPEWEKGHLNPDQPVGSTEDAE